MEALKIKFAIYVVIVSFFLSGCAIDVSNNQGDTPINTNSTALDYKSIVEHNKSENSIYAQIIGDRNLWVYQPLKNSYYVAHYFEKDKLDDFILYSSSIIGEFKNNVFTPINYVMAGSNKEFAFRLRPAKSTGNFYWFPEHENIGTTFSKYQTISFDNSTQNISETGVITKANSILIEQSLLLKYPESEDIVAELNIETSISSDGVSYHGTVKWLMQTEIEKGYVAMLPTVTPTMNMLFTSSNDIYPLLKTDSYTDIKNSDLISTYIFKGSLQDDVASPIALVQKINSLSKSLRVNEAGIRNNNIVWLEHRNMGENQKLYPQVYENHITSVGETFEFSSSVFTGLHP